MMKRAITIGATLCVAMCVAVCAAGAFTAARTPSRDIDEWRVRALSTHDWTSMTKLRAVSWAGNDTAALALGTVLVAQKDDASVREGIGCLTRSARSGDTDAQLLLGRVFFNSATGQSQDYVQSRACLERAAQSLLRAPQVSDDEDGHAPLAGAQAAYWLSSIHRNGYGVAHGFRRRSALARTRRGTRHAAGAISACQCVGYRERGDDAQALRWLRKSAHAELPEANLALAIAYRNGELGLHRDDEAYWTYVKETLHDYKHRVQP